jgi:mono/diheme cytochrome c family protein
MQTKAISMLVGASLTIGANAIGFAADTKPKVDIGQSEYRNSCALCHGLDGKGGGSVLDLLKKSPPDLTTLRQKNKGVFPFEHVYAVIDGRDMVKGHGDRDMPAWGYRYSMDKEKAAEYYVDVPYNMEMYVQSRILALIDYLNRIQVK